MKIHILLFKLQTTNNHKETDAYREWCEQIYIKCGRYDSPEVAEAKKRIAISKAYAELTKLQTITTNHIFLTINSPPDIDFLNFQKHINKLINKKWISKYLFYEQRGETHEEQGRGFHAHILIEHTPKKPCEIKRELANTLKDIMDVENYHILNIKRIDSAEAKRKVSYIIGTKKDTEKHVKQKYDIIWRQTMNLDPYYNMSYILEDAV